MGCQGVNFQRYPVFLYPAAFFTKNRLNGFSFQNVSFPSQVLELMREVAEEAGESLAVYEDDSSDLSGYHSDSDSAIMTSGNSPFVSPRARYNFLSRSGTPFENG